MKVLLQERIRARLRRLVDAEDVSHATFGKFIKKSRSATTRIINGHAAITLQTLEAISNFFQVSVAELVVEPDALIQAVTPLEAQLLTNFRSMSELEKNSLLVVLARREIPQRTTRRRARWGHAELTRDQQDLVELYMRSEPQQRDGVMKILRGTARSAHDGRKQTDDTSE